jgi:rhodanese-related sulfurtransferase
MKYLKFLISPKKITWENAFDKINKKNSKKILLVDLRQTFEHKDGTIENSIFLPLSKLNKKYLILDKNKTIFLFCRSGKRSSIGARLLQVKGYKNIYSIKGGFQEYKKSVPK